MIEEASFKFVSNTAAFFCCPSQIRFLFHRSGWKVIHSVIRRLAHTREHPLHELSRRSLLAGGRLLDTVLVGVLSFDHVVIGDLDRPFPHLIPVFAVALTSLEQRLQLRAELGKRLGKEIRMQIYVNY
jgi:hypothetical protein